MAMIEPQQPRSAAALTASLAQALGVPKFTRAVLTLEVGKQPTLQVETYMTDSAGRFVTEEVPGEYGEPVEKRIKRIQFKLRLEPCAEVE